MRRPGLLSLFAALALGAASSGCANDEHVREKSFGPTHLRIHPTFTQIKDWTGDKKPDGIEVVVELRDEMDEPVRAPGKLIFEVFSYRKDEPTATGDRIVNPWVGSLLTKQEQADHWSPALRAYTFQLAWPKVRVDQGYVLSATFEPAEGATGAAGGRLFDRIVMEPQHENQGGRHHVRPAIPDKVGGSRG